MTPSEGGRPLEEIYADPVRFELLHNHMVKMLSLTRSEMNDGALSHIEFTPDRLEGAKRRLGEIDVVGFQEDFEQFCEKLRTQFGWELGRPVFMNRTAAERGRRFIPNADRPGQRARCRAVRVRAASSSATRPVPVYSTTGIWPSG